MAARKKIEDRTRGCGSRGRLAELAARRDAGDQSPEVLEMCRRHLDLAYSALQSDKPTELFPEEFAAQLKAVRADAVKDAIKAIRRDPLRLAAFSSCMDNYTRLLRAERAGAPKKRASKTRRAAKALSAADFDKVRSWGECAGPLNTLALRFCDLEAGREPAYDPA